MVHSVPMTAVRNAWYCAGFSHELTDKPIVRTILEEPILLMRGSDGQPVAMSDKCPHRAAPLHMGKVKGDRIQCIYHGLEFDMKGRCVLNPHGDQKIPAAAKVKSYAVAERYNVVWLWAGDAAQADEDRIPSFWRISEHPAQTQIYGQLRVDCHYQHLVDNLLDASHIEYLHPTLGVAGQTALFDSETTPHGPHGLRYRADAPMMALNDFYKFMWGPDAPEQGVLNQSMYWDAPSNLYYEAAVSGDGDWNAPHLQFCVAHMLVPVDETTTDYFWTASRNRQVDSKELSDAIGFGLKDVFEREDAAVLVQAQQYMGTHDLKAAGAVLLSVDVTAMRARRIVDNLLQAESANRVAA